MVSVIKDTIHELDLHASPQGALQSTSLVNNATFSLAHSPQATSTTIYIPLKDTARVLSLERVFLARLVPYVGDSARRFRILQRSQPTFYRSAKLLTGNLLIPILEGV
jgi:hypothetical protein